MNKLKLETVKDVMDVQAACIELSSRLEDAREAFDFLPPCVRDAMFNAVQVLDFFSDEVLPNLGIVH